MTKIIDNIEELKKILNEEPFDKVVALEFLEAIEENWGDIEGNVDSLKDENKVLEVDNRSKDSYISELEMLLENQDSQNTIQCGIGTINYEADNLALQDIMENLDAAIQKTNFSKVREVLATI